MTRFVLFPFRFCIIESQMSTFLITGGLVIILTFLMKNMFLAKMAIVIRKPSTLSRGQCALVAARAVIGKFYSNKN